MLYPYSDLRTNKNTEEWTGMIIKWWVMQKKIVPTHNVDNIYTCMHVQNKSLIAFLIYIVASDNWSAA